MARRRELSPEEACREKALQLLERRGHARRELELKLIKRAFSRGLIRQVLDEFERTGLIGDAAFARAYAEYVLAGGKQIGRRRVVQELRKRGVSAEVVETVLNETWDARPDDADEVARARDAADTKLRILRYKGEPRLLQAKLYRFLAGRGFAPDVCGQVAREKAYGSNQDDI